MVSFYVTLTPLEPYFFGSERKLGDGLSNSRSTYFIRSETMPFQTTLLGMFRFFLLKQSGCVRDDYQIDTELIGRESFNMAGSLSNPQSDKCDVNENKEQNFGVIQSISPLFLTDQDDNYYIATPKNHQVGQKVYTPYEMFKMEADGRKYSYLPSGYSGKEGTAQSYTRVSDGRIFDREDVSGGTANVGIYKKADEEGYFKKEYRYFKVFHEDEKGKEIKLRFACFISLDENADVFKRKLPHFMEENAIIKDIVYMGLGKSAFAIEVKKKENDFFRKTADLIKKNDESELIVYYTASDTLFIANPELPFAIIETGNFRHLTTGKKEYWDRMSASALYQVVKPGSMFFLRKEVLEEFHKSYGLKNNKKIGMNQMIGSIPVIQK